jgi:hypothetical protein
MISVRCAQRVCQRDAEVVATGLRWKAGRSVDSTPSAVTHLRKIEGFRRCGPLEIVVSREVRRQRPSISSPMLQPVLVTELVTPAAIAQNLRRLAKLAAQPPPIAAVCIG